MGHHFWVVAVVAILCWTVVAIVRGASRRRAGGPSGLSGEEGRRLAELTLVADRMQARIDSLERLLDGVQPDWRTRS